MFEPAFLDGVARRGIDRLDIGQELLALGVGSRRTLPSKYLWMKVMVLLTRLPQAPESSPLLRSTNSRQEKSASLASGPLTMRK